MGIEMEPLQIAALGLLEQWGSPRMNRCLIDLRTALADEQAHTVEPVEANRDEVICPKCVHQFRAIPENVQQLMLDAGFEPPFTHPAPPKSFIRERAQLEQEWCELQKLKEAQQVAVPVADMFWNHHDAEKLYGSIPEFLNDEMCNGTPLEVGDILTVQRAVRLPNVDVRITSTNEEECDADYEIVEESNDKKQSVANQVVPRVVVELPDGDKRTVKTWFTEMRNGELVVSISVDDQKLEPMTEEQIINVAKETKTAEPGNDGYILPISFTRAIEAHHGIKT